MFSICDCLNKTSQKKCKSQKKKYLQLKLSNNKEYEVELNYDSEFYNKKMINNLPKLYYLISGNDYDKFEYRWK